jgi:hypothetical protein
MTSSAPTLSPGHHLTTAPMRNGLGVAALACGLTGILFGQVPLLFLGSGALGVLAIVFGVIGIRRARRGRASNRAMAVTGLVTGVVASGLAIWGVVIIMSGLNTVGAELDHLDHGTAAPAQAAHAVVHEEDLLVHQAMFVGNS